jgi:hypothetical protein
MSDFSLKIFSSLDKTDILSDWYFWHSKESWLGVFV